MLSGIIDQLQSLQHSKIIFISTVGCGHSLAEADLGFQKGGANMNGWLAKKSNNWLIQIQCVASVQSTLNMWSMFYLGGLGACPHRKILQI